MKNRYISIFVHSKHSVLVIVSITVAIIVIAGHSFESYYSRKRDIFNAQIQANNLSQVLEEQISTSFKKIDIILQELQDHYRNESDESISKKFDYFSKLMAVQHSRLPEILGFRAVDANGNFTANDLGISSKANVLDRDFYQHLKKYGRDELVVSKPVFSKMSHVWVVALARPLLTKEGKFRGLVIGSITLDHYHKMFSAVNIGKNSEISLYRNDHFLYARTPSNENLYGKEVNIPIEIDNLLKSSNAFSIFRHKSPLDNIERISVSRKMTHYPFVVVVGLSLQEVLRSWHTRVWIHSAFLAFIFFAFAYFLYNFLKSLEELEEERKHSVQSSKLSSLGEMAAGIAHEINNPLTIIATLASTTKCQTPDTEEKIKLNKNLEKISATVTRIAKIINGLKTFARDSYNDPSVPTSVNQIIINTLDLCTERLKNRSIELKLISFVDFEIDCRDVQISQVIMSLLNNSVDAIENCEIKWIQIEVRDLGSDAMIRISDSGNKISDEIAEKIMQPFYTTKEIGKGTGLGLSISKGIIEGHRGKFYLDQASEHTTFVIEVPKSQSTK